MAFPQHFLIFRIVFDFFQKFLILKIFRNFRVQILLVFLYCHHISRQEPQGLRQLSENDLSGSRREKSAGGPESDNGEMDKEVSELDEELGKELGLNLPNLQVFSHSPESDLYNERNQEFECVLPETEPTTECIS